MEYRYQQPTHQRERRHSDDGLTAINHNHVDRKRVAFEIRAGGRPVKHQRYIGRAGSTQRGMTLVELMVSMTIGLIILAALGQLFVTSRATYATGEGLA